MRMLLLAVLIAIGSGSSTALADNAKCVGSPDRYEGSKSGCPDARAPKESKFKGETPAKDAPPPAPAPPVPKEDMVIKL